MQDLLRLPARAASGAVHVVIESPKGSRVKLKWDPALGAITLSRPLPSGLSYPYDWGFVPGTLADDGDPLDALVYWDAGSYPGVVLACRPVGVVNGSRAISSRFDLSNCSRMTLMGCSY